MIDDKELQLNLEELRTLGYRLTRLLDENEQGVGQWWMAIARLQERIAAWSPVKEEARK